MQKGIRSTGCKRCVNAIAVSKVVFLLWFSFFLLAFIISIYLFRVFFSIYY